MSIFVDMKAAGYSLKTQGKPGQSWGRKDTGPRILRDNQDDFQKDPKIAGLPKIALTITLTIRREDLNMTIRQFMSYSIGFMAITCYVGTAGAEKPTRDIYKYTATYEADEVWYDYFGYYGACGFRFMVDVDARYTTHYLKGRELINILIRDTYTNLDTGFSFEDFGSYKIVVDYETGLADHRGVFWRIRIPGEGVVLLDVGSFLQDWSGPWPWPIVEGTLIGNNHDVNGPISEGELPPVSYCDLMSGTFPE